MGLYDDSCALIDMYSKCGSVEDARFVFNEMPEKTTVGWNSIIAGYALHGYSEEALNIYYEMQDSGVKMDHFTFSIIMQKVTYKLVTELDHMEVDNSKLFPPLYFLISRFCSMHDELVMTSTFG
ncbi:Pentatricopeptide repeat-containing protein [Abeliophyllum distichum]|uniref:Pentatricopeptide repeat-containing protein n=1 Tax=Abeliophyllum distichum TaxID=126358 RepID=A0ABD1R7H5_9LAMI